MLLFLAHAVLLLWIAHLSTRRLFHSLLDRVLALALLGWGNIVLTGLLLACLHRLGEPVWFFGTSVALACTTWLLLRQVRPEPASPAPLPGDEGKFSRVLLALFVLTLSPLVYASLRLGLAYEPNNYDSLTYHLPRMMFYLGQNSLAHFDTGNDRQIYFPFNYNLLQLFCLIYSAPLQCLNFLNLASWVTAGLAIYRLCRLSALSANSALIAVWLALTSTQVLAQANATTNDLPVGAGLLCTLVFAWRWRHSRQTRDALLAGLAAGLTAGSKLTVVFFGPSAGLIVLALAWQYWRHGEIRAFFQGVRAWLVPGLLACVMAAPFAVINLAEKGQWMNRTYDYTLNRPFSLACAAQTTGAYLFQLFLEPLQRFTVDSKITAQLNGWGKGTFFPNWNPDHAFSPFYLFPNDLTEDHVWFGLTGPFILLCAVFCLGRMRRVGAPVLWLALIGLGWFATYFLLNKWSLYNQRYFVPAILVMSPCAAAVFAAARTKPFARRGLHLLLTGLMLCSLWLAGVYLFKNSRRPYAPLWAGQPPPPALPVLPPLMRERLAAQPRINIKATDGNERIFLLMTPGQNQRFTSFAQTDPNAYNVFSEWGHARKVAYRNIEQLSSYTTVEIPTKRSAGVEFLGTIGSGTDAQDYYGLVPSADLASPTAGNRNVLVILSYASREPNRYMHTRIQVAGLNPSDQARLIVGVEYEDQTSESLASFRGNGEVPASILKPFRRFTVRVEDQADGRTIGAINIPVLDREKPAEFETPHDPALIFGDELVANHPLTYIISEGLAIADGPYPQWELPLVRWAKAPVARLEIPAADDLVRLRLNFSLRLHTREHAGLYLVFNGRPVKHYRIDSATSWLDATIELEPAAGKNVLEFRNVAIGTEPDWMDYLERYPDVKDFVVSSNIPLAQGAQQHYESFGRKENRIVNRQMTPEPVPLAEPLYFLFRRIYVEGFRNP